MRTILITFSLTLPPRMSSLFKCPVLKLFPSTLSALKTKLPPFSPKSTVSSSLEETNPLISLKDGPKTPSSSSNGPWNKTTPATSSPFGLYAWATKLSLSSPPAIQTTCPPSHQSEAKSTYSTPWNLLTTLTEDTFWVTCLKDLSENLPLAKASCSTTTTGSFQWILTTITRTCRVSGK